MAKEKDWAANIGEPLAMASSCRLMACANNSGMLDWDSTRIVFSKRTLIEFLRYYLSS